MSKSLDLAYERAIAAAKAAEGTGTARDVYTETHRMKRSSMKYGQARGAAPRHPRKTKGAKMVRPGEFGDRGTISRLRFIDSVEAKIKDAIGHLPRSTARSLDYARRVWRGEERPIPSWEWDVPTLNKAPKKLEPYLDYIKRIVRTGA